MAFGGSAFLFVLLHYTSLEAYAAQSELYTFESYADASCSASALSKTDYLKEVTGSAGCHVYTMFDGYVANGASSFTLTCTGDYSNYAQYAEYESSDCTGSTVSSGTTPWFTTTMCVHKASSNSGYGTGVVFTAHTGSSCTKSYFPTR